MREIIDLTGRKFGRLTALQYLVKSSERKRSQWLCICDCGAEVKVYSNNLRSGHTQSCGCFQKENISKLKYKDLTGLQFGKLYVIERHPDKYRSNYCWLWSNHNGGGH